MDRKELNWVAALPWIPVVVSIVFLWRYVLMSKDLAIALIGAAAVIIAALIGGVVALVTQNAQLKRDSGTLKEIRKAASEKIVPTLGDIKESSKAQSEILGDLAADLEHRKRLEARLPAGSQSKDMIDAGIQAIFRQYDALSERCVRLQAQNEALTMKNVAMREEIQRLEMAVRQAGRSESQADDLAAGDWEPEI